MELHNVPQHSMEENVQWIAEERNVPQVDFDAHYERIWRVCKDFFTCDNRYPDWRTYEYVKGNVDRWNEGAQKLSIIKCGKTYFVIYDEGLDKGFRGI